MKLPFNEGLSVEIDKHSRHDVVYSYTDLQTKSRTRALALGREYFSFSYSVKLALLCVNIYTRRTFKVD